MSLQLIGISDRDSAVVSKITFTADYYDEHLSCSVFQMIMPLTELVKRSFVINCVTQNSYLGTTQEKVSQVVHR